MKDLTVKKIVLLACLLGIFPAGSAMAAPCYGSFLPCRNQLVAGVQTYNLIRRDLEGDYGKIRSLQYFFMLSYGLTDWLTLDGKVGTGTIKARPQTTDNLDYQPAFAGGYGFRVRLYRSLSGRLTSIFGFHHISTHPYSKAGALGENKAILDDWQVSLVMGIQLARIRPYFGLKWSRVDYIHWLENDRKRIMSDLTKNVGLIAGVNIPLYKGKVFLDLEGHFFDETAASLALLYAF